MQMQSDGIMLWVVLIFKMHVLVQTSNIHMHDSCTTANDPKI